MALAIFFNAAFWLAVYTVCPKHCERQSSAWTELSQFFDTASSSAAYTAAEAQQKTTVYMDRALANFSIHLSGSLGTARPRFLPKKV